MCGIMHSSTVVHAWRGSWDSLVTERAGSVQALTPVVPLLLTEEALSKLSLPPAVLRKAQQLPGVFLLPNGHEVGPCSL